MSLGRLKNVIQVQPLRKCHQVTDFGDFDELLEKDTKSTPGFEIVAGINFFEIKKRDRKGGDDYWETSWTYDIVGDRRQSLLLAVKETQWSCISKYSVIVSAFTDVYKDPVFLCNIKPHQTDHCCRITTANPNSIIGFISASTRNSFLLTNQAEDLILNTTVSSETPGTVVYDIWEDTTFVGTVTCGSLKDHFTIFSIESLSPTSKVLFFGLAFYLTL